MFIQLIISGIVAGSIYALIALAMSIIYKASEIANFAQGEMAMLSSYIAFVILSFHLPFYLAFAGSLQHGHTHHSDDHRRHVFHSFIANTGRRGPKRFCDRRRLAFGPSTLWRSWRSSDAAW